MPALDFRIFVRGFILGPGRSAEKTRVKRRRNECARGRTVSSVAWTSASILLCKVSYLGSGALHQLYLGTHPSACEILPGSPCYCPAVIGDLGDRTPAGRDACTATARACGKGVPPHFLGLPQMQWFDFLVRQSRLNSVTGFVDP